MEFTCSICQYTSDKKNNVLRHISKKISCGTGNREIIEIPTEIKCEFCKKLFSTKQHLRDHIKKTCKDRDIAMKMEIDDLKEKVKELVKEKTEEKTVTNNNTYNIFILNNYEDTKLDKLTDKIYNKIIRDSEEVYQIIPRLLKEIHFNPNIPENHNIVLSNRNKNNKYILVYRNNHWEIELKDTEIDNLICDKENNLSDWVTEKAEKYPEAFRRFNEYIEQKYDEDMVKLVKEEVELVLYNNRHMIKRT